MGFLQKTWHFIVRCALVLVLTALAGELYLYCRGAVVADDFVPDPVLFLSPRPGAPLSDEDPQVRETVGDNFMRRCRPDPGYSRPLRVLVSGCSYTFGVGVADEDTYVWRLNELCPSADFDNIGVGGFGPYRCYLHQRQFLSQRHYDLVIYAMQGNHLDRDSWPHMTFLHAGSKSDLMVYPYVELKGESNFVEHPLEMPHWPGDTHSRLINFLRNSTLLLRERLVPYPNQEQKSKIFAYIVNKMALQARQHGAKFVMAVLNRNPVPQDLFSSDVAIMDISYNRGAELPAELRVRGNRRNHPNGRVHEIWAQSLARQLTERHYLDGPSNKPMP